MVQSTTSRVASATLAVLVAGGCAPTQRDVATETFPSPPTAAPRLAVVLVVDQMRADYLDRFRSQYIGGLAWLTERGAVWRNAHHDHAVTSTAPGHTTLATGVFPSRHGIVGNNFYDRRARRTVYSVADSTCTILGFPDAAGRSPANILRSGLADWLKAQSPDSKVWAVAIKDRSAIPMAGKRPDGAYWYHLDSGRFVTSSYYGSRYPEWVTGFNESGRAESYFGEEWTRLLPDSAYTLSREDSFAAESDGTATSFPHRIGNPGGSPDRRYYRSLPTTPFAEELVLAFADAIISEEGLGEDEVPDILFVGLSAADFIGHAYGPYSQEVQDYYLRLDRLLGEFIDRLARRIGEAELLVALSADHGVMPMPEELARRGIDSRRTDPRGILSAVEHILEEAVERDVISERPRVRLVSGLVLEFAEARPSPEEEAALQRLLAEKLRGEIDLGAAFSREEILTGSGSGEVFERFRRSVHPDRAPDVFYAPRQNYLLTRASTRTSHGSPHAYDTHVPLVVAGAGIRPMTSDDFVRTVDLAPTLAAILGIDPPDDLDGRALGLQR